MRSGKERFPSKIEAAAACAFSVTMAHLVPLQVHGLTVPSQINPNETKLLSIPVRSSQNVF